MATPPFDSAARATLVQRVTDILLRPRETWPKIDTEDGSPAHIYRSYLVFLAAIPAVAGFIGSSLIGVSAFGVTMRVPVVSGLVNMVVSYALTLAMVYLLALIANALAPRFQGSQDMGSALKLVAYGITASLVGGVFSIVPLLAILGLLAALYSVYLLYTGVPVLMKVPQERAVGYTALLVVCGIVAGLVVGLLSALFTPGTRGMGAGFPDSGRSGPVSIEIPGTDIRIDTSRIEEASRKMEQAQASGDHQAAARATTDMIGAVLGGGKDVQAFSVQQLRATLPDTLASLARTGIEARANQMMGVQYTQANAQYEQDGKFVEIQIHDIGTSSMLVIGMAGWANGTAEKENADEVERIYRQGDVAFRENYRKDGSNASLDMLLPNSVMLSVNGTLGMDEIKRLVQPVAQQLGALRRAS